MIEVMVRPFVPNLSNEVQRAVEEIWQRVPRAPEPGGELFNGLVFTLDLLGEDEAGRVSKVEGRFVPYSWYVAAREDAVLSRTLRLSVMGVSGLLECSEGVVVGIRGATQQERGSLELVPSGTLDDSCASNGRIDVRAHVLKELREEIGVAPGALIAEPLPFALIQDDASGVADLGLRMRTDMSIAAIQAAHESLECREYESVAALEPVQIPDLLVSPRTIVPASLGLLKAAGILGS